MKGGNYGHCEPEPKLPLSSQRPLVASPTANRAAETGLSNSGLPKRLRSSITGKIWPPPPSRQETPGTYFDLPTLSSPPPRRIDCTFRKRLPRGWPILRAVSSREGWDRRTSTILSRVTEMSGQLISSLECGPTRFDLYRSSAAGRVMPKARPCPIFRLLNQSPFYRIPMHIAQLLNAFLFVMHAEIIIPALPELNRPRYLQLARCLLLQHLEHNRQ